MKLNMKHLSYLFSAVILLGCGGTADIISTPVENIDSSPLKVTELTDAEKENWGHLDLERDTIPGMAVDRAYDEIIKGKKGEKGNEVCEFRAGFGAEPFDGHYAKIFVCVTQCR